MKSEPDRAWSPRWRRVVVSIVAITILHFALIYLTRRAWRYFQSPKCAFLVSPSLEIYKIWAALVWPVKPIGYRPSADVLWDWLATGAYDILLFFNSLIRAILIVAIPLVVKWSFSPRPAARGFPVLPTKSRSDSWDERDEK